MIATMDSITGKLKACSVHTHTLANLPRNIHACKVARWRHDNFSSMYTQIVNLNMVGSLVYVVATRLKFLHFLLLMISIEELPSAYGRVHGHRFLYSSIWWAAIEHKSYSRSIYYPSFTRMSCRRCVLYKLHVWRLWSLNLIYHLSLQMLEHPSVSSVCWGCELYWGRHSLDCFFRGRTKVWCFPTLHGGPSVLWQRESTTLVLMK